MVALAIKYDPRKILVILKLKILKCIRTACHAHSQEQDFLGKQYGLEAYRSEVFVLKSVLILSPHFTAHHCPPVHTIEIIILEESHEDHSVQSGVKTLTHLIS